jgi:plastocyanin
MRRIAPVLALLGALAILTSACASSKATGLPAGPTEAPTTAACPAEIEMTDTLRFEPQTCSLKVGTTVTWTNGSIQHTVTSEPDSPVEFDSGTVAGGGEYSFTFETAAVVPYYCKLHTGPGLRTPNTMIGTITVEAA